MASYRFKDVIPAVSPEIGRMAMELEKSQTRENLMRAFAGESMARNRYTFAAAAAKKEGYPVLELLFRYTAEQERAHGGIWYRYLRGCGCTNLEITAGFPVDLKSDTLSLLEYAVQHEEEEHTVVYPAFAKIACEEGFREISGKMDLTGKIEQEHAERFRRFLEYLKEDRLFVSEQETGWMCLNCGFSVSSREAPKECPVCGHPQGWFCRLELTPYHP